jgi:N-carbamoylputrescine amidase
MKKGATSDRPVDQFQINPLDSFRCAMRDIRLALVVANCPVAAIEKNLESVAQWSEKAARQGAEVICFPELNVTGYGAGKSPAQTVLPVPGPETERLVEIARASSLVVLAGLAEKDKQGRVFATHLVAAPQGLAGIYRKLHVAPPEQAIFSPGNRILIHALRGVTFGIQLCYDAHFPELATRMALEGCDLIVIPHASPRGSPKKKLASWMRHLSARAFDNGVFVAACNQVGGNGNGLEFPGVAVVIGPDGRILQQYVADQEGLLLVDLKSTLLSSVRRHRMRYFLPHRRPDAYRL